MELALELVRAGTTVDSGLNHIFQDTPNSGEPSGTARADHRHGHACVERQIADNMKGFVADYARKPGMGPASTS